MVEALDQEDQGVHPHPLGINHCCGFGRREWIWSCHKHQKSKLYMLPDIVPDIIPDIKILLYIVIINLQYRIFLFNIEGKTFDVGPSIQIYPSLPLNIWPNIEYFLQYWGEVYSISGLIFNFDSLCHPSAPDIEGFYSILGMILDKISAYKEIGSIFRDIKEIYRILNKLINP